MLTENERIEIKKFSKELSLDYYEVVVFINKHIKTTQELIGRNLSFKEVKEQIRHSKYYLMTNII